MSLSIKPDFIKNRKESVKLGKFGENIACEYLIKKGYKIITRNYSQKWGELDIIGKAPDKTLVFVEVKTIRQSRDKQDEEMIRPEDQITGPKLQKLQRTASLYANSRPELMKKNRGWQIDLLAIRIKGDDFDIKHYENI